MPGGLLGAISGILAGGILGFGAAKWIVLLDTFARSCFLFWCFVFVSAQDLVIQWHHQPTPWVVWSGLSSLFLLFGWFCLFGVLLLLGFPWVLGLTWPQTASLHFQLPNAGHSNCICLIRSSAQPGATTKQEPQRRRTEKKNDDDKFEQQTDQELCRSGCRELQSPRI